MGVEKVYFPNLNGLRFIAAAMVIIHHIEQLKHILKMDNYWNKTSPVFLCGEMGVILFFVLSGFLITYLLLTEEKTYQTIAIRKFYVRRILRIWPLYFFIVALALFVFPHVQLFNWPGYGKEVIYQNLGLKILLFVFLFPNLIVSYWGIIPYASQTWSIGTEEQFYLIWPLLMKWVKRYRTALMLMIVLVYVIIGQFLASPNSDSMPFKYIIQPFWTTFRVDCLAIGGCFGILLFQKNRYVLKTTFFSLSLISVIVLLILGVFFPPLIHHLIYAVLFGYIITNFAANKALFISLENRLLKYLGSISYGLYMYHLIGIILAISIAQMLNNTSNWLLYPLSFSITALMAGLSYKYFESFFLRLKSKFSIVKSGLI